MVLEGSNFGSVGKSIIIIGTVGSVAAIGYRFWKKNCDKFQVVGKVSAIYLYPVKSCRRISIQEGQVTKLGVKSGTIRDREFMIVKSNGHFITARQEPTMLLIAPSIHGDELWLDAPKMPTLKVTKPKANMGRYDETPDIEAAGAPTAVTIFGENLMGFNCGSEASKWISDFLGKPGFKLVHFPHEVSPRQPKDTDHWARFKKTDNSVFADLTAFMLLSEASVDDLNSRLKNKITIHNFRPSLAVEGCNAYDEEKLKFIKIGGASFRNVKPCNRCVLTTIDPETGIKDGIEPIKTLKTYKQMTDPADRKLEGESPVFGVHLAADKLGVIRVGDPIYATV